MDINFAFSCRVSLSKRNAVTKKSRRGDAKRSDFCLGRRANAAPTPRRGAKKDRGQPADRRKRAVFAAACGKKSSTWNTAGRRPCSTWNSFFILAVSAAGKRMPAVRPAELFPVPRWAPALRRSPVFRAPAPRRRVLFSPFAFRPAPFRARAAKIRGAPPR